MNPMAVTSVLCLHYRPKTVHYSTKDAYNSEITFLTLHPCIYPRCSIYIIYTSILYRCTTPDGESGFTTTLQDWNLTEWQVLIKETIILK